MANVFFFCASQDAMDGGALQNLVGFLRERRGQAGIVYCHKVGNFLGYGASVLLVVFVGVLV